MLIDKRTSKCLISIVLIWKCIYPFHHNDKSTRLTLVLKVRIWPCRVLLRSVLCFFTTCRAGASVALFTAYKLIHKNPEFFTSNSRLVQFNTLNYFYLAVVSVVTVVTVVFILNTVAIEVFFRRKFFSVIFILVAITVNVRFVFFSVVTVVVSIISHFCLTSTDIVWRNYLLIPLKNVPKDAPISCFGLFLLLEVRIQLLLNGLRNPSSGTWSDACLRRWPHFLITSALTLILIIILILILILPIFI